MGPGGLNFRVRDGNGCDPSGKIAGNLLKEAVSVQLSAFSQTEQPRGSLLNAESGWLTASFLNSVASLKGESNKQPRAVSAQRNHQWFLKLIADG